MRAGERGCCYVVVWDKRMEEKADDLGRDREREMLAISARIAVLVLQLLLSNAVLKGHENKMTMVCSR